MAKSLTIVSGFDSALDHQGRAGMAKRVEVQSAFDGLEFPSALRAHRGDERASLLRAANELDQFAKEMPHPKTKRQLLIEKLKDRHSLQQKPALESDRDVSR